MTLREQVLEHLNESQQHELERRRAYEERFIQICSVGASLYALDALGIVWAYHYGRGVWVNMTRERDFNPDIDYHEG